ncbi:Kelch repeat protein [Metarhizium robertsii]|uniref:Kelch repeat-containing protein n=2 Tax=Metarhizium robertsii TaxID=568076 RepID=E9F509_METRA|nr:kelch repeat-containing protein [Metarhizium robertsii ARSEF 23]EFY97062.1 kelch repeat-containing protein [Metarhizium robertsii ARSEF 23]EXV00647.1 Kelch repeat protein [Metarhizium robertsii]
MAFLFKSKKSQDRALSSRDGNSGSQGSIQSTSSRLARDEKNAAAQRATPTGSLNSVDENGTSSPEQLRRGGSLEQTQPSSDLPLRNTPPASNPNASLYPWSQRRLTYTPNHPSPFPRYGAAVNATASKEGDIYMMGGLINSSTVKGDLWLIEAGGNLACYPLATTAEGPGPRVGHSSLLVGNAFIVYGGDTKIEESDTLDETLYLLNTSTRHWSRALPAGPRPSGRYGHSLNILGSKIYIFGGQVEGYFMNDLSAFDLNQLQSPNNRWEILLPGDTSPKAPAARTNHSMITFNDKMYLFGGTNGFQWFNDVWCYDPAVNKWAQLDCIGYIPAPREGHAAALVDDVMYVFGGRTEEGTDLGDLAAFRISSRRWYTFQNMGPSPSARSGHSMTNVGKSIVVLGGEPSSATTTINDLGIMYVLDTTKIRYPNDSQQGAQRVTQGTRRPSGSEVPNATVRQLPAASSAQDPRKQGNAPVTAATAIPTTPANKPPNGYHSPPPGGPEQQNTGAPSAPSSSTPPSKVPRAGVTPSPAGPPPQGPTPAKPTVETSAVGRARGASADRTGASGSPQTTRPPQAAVIASEVDTAAVNGRRTPTTQASPVAQPTRNGSKQESPAGDAGKAHQKGHRHLQGSVDSSAESGARAIRPSSPPPPTRQTSNPLSRRSSGRNSQTVALLKELDSSRNRNAWYASELELARKAGYVSSATMAPLDAKAAETFDDEDRPLIEALLAMKTELANVQSAVDKQAVVAAKQIAEAEKQRDAAIQEAVYAKAKLTAYSGGSSSSTPQLDGERDEPADRSGEIGKKLATALHLHKDLKQQLESLRTELSAEKNARQLADDTTSAAQKRMADLETYRQQTSTEVERLKAELHLVQREAREKSVACAEAVAALELIRVERGEFESKYKEAVGSSKDHNATFETLRSAIAASQDARSHLEKKLEEERLARESVEDKLNKLKTEHEARATELATSTQRLRDAEELVEKHSNEARTHREALLSGLGKITTRDLANGSKGDSGRLVALQNQLATANELVKKYQQEADAAADKLRSAEERIAGLEQYQEQSSREGVAIRRQLQSALRETQSLQAGHTELKNKLAAQQLETNAMTVQHNTLKDILAERGISPTGGAVRGRSLASPRTSSPDQSRVRDLEMQLANATAAHEESRQQFASQQQESEMAYRDKLQQLESDYQSAVHYVKGTEKMLKQLKDQLTRYKTDNGRLKSQMEELRGRLEEAEGDGQRSGSAQADWQAERDALHQRVEALEMELKTSGSKLEQSREKLKKELADSRKQRDEAVKDLDLHKKDLEQLQTENALLEQRTTDAEQKVALLLDQVEHSVDNYRRRSRQIPNIAIEGTNGGAHGHSRNESSENESTYEGNSLDARNSAALDNLASELETLRSHWEATNKNYRLSTNFDFDSPAVGKKANEGSTDGGLSDSLADWRKRLDTEDQHAGSDKV